MKRRLVEGGLALGLLCGAPPSGAAPPAPPTVPLDMVVVPEGRSWMGLEAGNPEERPTREVWLSLFAIDRTEVAVEAFRACVEARVCRTPVVYPRCNWGVPGKDRHPMNCVDWDDARTYCGWVGRRLPTEAEWEKAARGTDGRLYPWGSEKPTCERATIEGCSKGLTSEVGLHPRGASPYGALDMTGNVREWVADYYAPNAYTTAPAKNPRGPKRGKLRVLRGGSWVDACPWCLRVTARVGAEPGEKPDYFTGFRCALDLGGEKPPAAGGEGSENPPTGKGPSRSERGILRGVPGGSSTGGSPPRPSGGKR